MTLRPHHILTALFILLLAACGGSADSTATTAPQTEPAATETVAVAPPTADLPTATAQPEPSATNTAEPAPTLTPISSNSADADNAQPGYLDDRSTPVAVLESLYNAINSKQYARAYSYWEESNDLAPFDQFSAGYADTDQVELTTGDVNTGAAAGNRYYGVPVILHVSQTDGSQQIFAGCYTLHLAQPDIQAAPPFHPMAIQRGDLQQVNSDADARAILEQGCQEAR
ncbi:MAG: hypothetical protein M9890_05165 [Thermomicrobiales bacterium]|nr:hypothetical protein [Thermomicrobiales bacterium]